MASIQNGRILAYCIAIVLVGYFVFFFLPLLVSSARYSVGVSPRPSHPSALHERHASSSSAGAHQVKEEELQQTTPNPGESMNHLPASASNPGESMNPLPAAAPKKQARDECQQHITVNEGDTLNDIAMRFGIPWQSLASSNQLANPDLLIVGQNLCIPLHSSSPVPRSTASVSPAVSTPTPAELSPMGQVGTSNAFPYRQCTWWANERYHQLHGVYVPWKMNANAWQWGARAADFGWQISSTPQVGSIIDMQPGVQGAFDQGHVGVVEQVYDDGRVQVSSMNWGGATGQVTFTTFMPGAGVSFLHQ